METRKEQRIAELAREKSEEEIAEDQRRRASEDKMIMELEAEFWERSKSIQAGKVEPVLPESRAGPGITAAPTIDSIISDDALDQLLDFFDKGGTVDLGKDRPTSSDTSAETENAWGQPDKETIEKAENVLKLLTAQMAQLDAKAESAKEQAAQQVRDEKAALAQGLPCELERMLIEKREQEEAEEAARKAEQEEQEEQEQVPKYRVEEQEESVTLHIELPRVQRVGDIEADVLERTKLELCVPGLYRLNYEISCPVDDEHMQCRFEKSSKVLTVKMPRIAS